MQKHLIAQKKQLTVHLAWQPSMQQLKQFKKLKQWLKQTENKLEQQSTFRCKYILFA